jgi:hypothetical protein
MVTCENCGHNIRDGTQHAPDLENGLCQIKLAATGEPCGFARRGIYKDMYARKNRG